MSSKSKFWYSAVHHSSYHIWRTLAVSVAISHLLPLACVLFFFCMKIVSGDSLRGEWLDLIGLLTLEPNSIGGDRSGAIKMLAIWHEICVFVCWAALALGAILAPSFGSKVMRPDYWPQVSARLRISIAIKYCRCAIVCGGALAIVVLGTHRFLIWFGAVGGAGERLALWLQSKDAHIGGWVVSAFTSVSRGDGISRVGIVHALPPLLWLLLCMTMPGFAMITLMNKQLSRLLSDGKVVVKSICVCDYPIADVEICPECGQTKRSGCHLPRFSPRLNRSV